MKEFLIKDLEQNKNSQKIKILSSFFKTKKGEYGEGDIFWGITIPKIREISKKYKNFSLKDIEELLKNPVHEIRFSALELLKNKYRKAVLENDLNLQKKIYDFYLKNSKRINNWDLVDTSAPYIIGDYLLKNKKERGVLFEFMKSNNLWQKRISVLATFPILKAGNFSEIEKIAIYFKDEKHDLIQKAVGWMLREAGKTQKDFLDNFLNKNYKDMPRTMLRYSIEKYPKEIRDKFLEKKF